MSSSSVQSHPLPSRVSGDVPELVESYLSDIDKQTHVQMVKYPGSKRIVFYNVKAFDFCRGADRYISSMLGDMKVDLACLIEYDEWNDHEIRHHYKYSCFYHQLQHYGIKVFSNKKITATAMSIEREGPYGVFEEARGMVHTEWNGLNVITLHLDVFDHTGQKRIEEIENVMQYIQQLQLKNVILGGDFNEPSMDSKRLSSSLIRKLHEDLYERTGIKRLKTPVADRLIQNGFVDVFEYLHHSKARLPKFSCWTGRLVDFVCMYLPTWTDDIQILNIEMMYVPFSDHLPIVLDVIKKVKI